MGDLTEFERDCVRKSAMRDIMKGINVWMSSQYYGVHQIPAEEWHAGLAMIEAEVMSEIAPQGAFVDIDPL